MVEGVGVGDMRDRVTLNPSMPKGHFYLNSLDSQFPI